MTPPFGVTVPDLGALIPTLTRRPLGELVDLAARCEELGYREIWVPESWCRDPFGMLHAIGTATMSVALGTGIATLPARTPTACAMAASTLTEAFPGRVRLGLGTGHPETVEHWHGVPFQASLERTREYVEVCRRVWSGEPLEPAGPVWPVSDFALAAPSAGEIPIYLAALGPRMLDLAGRIADGVLLTMTTPESIEWSVQTVRRAAHETGRDIQIDALLTVALGSPGDVDHAVKRSIATYGYWRFYRNHLAKLGFRDVARSLESVWTAAGQPAEVRRRWAAGDIPEKAESVVSDEVISAVAATDIEAVANRLDRYRQAGVDVPVIRPLVTGADAIGSLRASMAAVSDLR